MVDIIDGWPSSGEFTKYTARFMPFLSKAVSYPNMIPLQDLFTTQTVDISCAAGNIFAGDDDECEYVPMSARTYIDAFLSTVNGDSHWISNIDKLELYLSQVPLWTYSCPDTLNIIKKENLPSLLNQCTMHQCNLWVNIKAATTTLHYDGNHNILYVQSGHKTVLLLSPKHTPRLRPNSSVSSAPHHSRMDVAEVQELFPVLCSSQLPVSVVEDGAFIVQVRPGDALFIPEGWWHQVSSAECTHALNFWFHSPLHAMLCENSTSSHLVPYVLRAAAAQFMAGWKAEEGAATLEGKTHQEGLGKCNAGMEAQVVVNLFAAIEECPSVDGTEGPIRRLCDMFASCSVDDMWRSWVPAVKQYPAVWHRVIVGLTPAQCHSVISVWERSEAVEEAQITDGTVNRSRGEWGSIASLCEQLFTTGQTEGKAMQLRAHMVHQNNRFLVEQGSLAISRLLGLQSGCDERGGESLLKNLAGKFEGEAFSCAGNEKNKRRRSN